MDDKMDAAPHTEYRPYNPEQLACLVSLFRQAHGWSQETLAELAGVTPRTVQRVEAAEPSSLDTRRALARAFAMDDIDAFNRPYEMTTPEGAAKAKEDFDRRFVVIEVEPADGRELARSVSAAGPYRAISCGYVGRPPREVEDIYAGLLDYLRDVMDVADVAGHAEMLGYGDEMEAMIAGMRIHGWGVAIGSRKAPVTQARLPAEILYVLATPGGEERRSVAVPKDDRP